MFRKLAVAVLMLSASAAFAQLSVPDPDWMETEAPPPPPVRTDKLVRFDVPGTSLRFGVDPASVTVGEDRVVRYVVVATSSSGVVNAMYEGVRCNTGEVKVYARHSPGSGGWVPVRQADWQRMQDMPNLRYSLAIARQGACMGDAPNRSADQIVRDLGASVDRRFRTESSR